MRIKSIADFKTKDKGRLPVIIASHGRLELLKQTLDSLRKNSDSKLQIIVVNDFDEKQPQIINYLKTQKDIYYYKYTANVSIGQAKMTGSMFAEPYKYIYFSDDDVYFLPHWDTIMIKALKKYSDFVMVSGRGVHDKVSPRNLTKTHKVLETHLQTGYSMMMRRNQWNKYGEFPDLNEDSWISYEMRSRCGGIIGVIEPPIIVHCGYSRKTTSQGNNKGLAFDYKDIKLSMKKYPYIKFE